MQIHVSRPGFHAGSHTPRDNMVSLYPFYDAHRRKVLAANGSSGSESYARLPPSRSSGAMPSMP